MSIQIFVFKISPDDNLALLRHSDLQNDVFNEVKNGPAGGEPLWIDRSEILTLKTISRKAIFILPLFEGEHFRRLEELNAKICGSELFRQMLDRQEVPPIRNPLFSTILKNAVVSFTGISPQERTDNSSLIQYMGGRVCRQFDQSVTHLLADFCDPTSLKYQATRQLKIPVLSPKWISDLWTELCANGDISEIKFKRLTTQNILPIFRGCVICVSGFDARELIDIGQLIERHGGVYAANMNQLHCTHLIVSRNSGEKYKRALAWGIVKIVDLRWLKRSIECQHRLSEEKFSRATPKNTVKPDNVQLMARSFTATDEKPLAVPQSLHDVKNVGPTLPPECSNKIVPLTPGVGDNAADIPVVRKRRTIFDVVEQATKKENIDKETMRMGLRRNSLSRSGSSIGELRRQSSQAGTIRSGIRPNFAISGNFTAKLPMASPAKLPTEEMDSTQKNKSVMEWVEKTVVLPRQPDRTLKATPHESYMKANFPQVANALAVIKRHVKQQDSSLLPIVNSFSAHIIKMTYNVKQRKDDGRENNPQSPADSVEPAEDLSPTAVSTGYQLNRSGRPSSISKLVSPTAQNR